jgi:hypothetical protein
MKISILFSAFVLTLLLFHTPHPQKPLHRNQPITNAVDWSRKPVDVVLTSPADDEETAQLWNWFLGSIAALVTTLLAFLVVRGACLRSRYGRMRAVESFPR